MQATLVPAGWWLSSGNGKLDREDSPAVFHIQSNGAVHGLGQCPDYRQSQPEGIRLARPVMGAEEGLEDRLGKMLGDPVAIVRYADGHRVCGHDALNANVGSAISDCIVHEVAKHLSQAERVGSDRWSVRDHMFDANIRSRSLDRIQ